MNSARNTEGFLNGAGKGGDQPRRLCALTRTKFSPAQAALLGMTGLTLFPRETVTPFTGCRPHHWNIEITTPASNPRATALLPNFRATAVPRHQGRSRRTSQSPPRNLRR